jgi:FlaA1/EpsC-like NDP-sugar epimerase
MLDMGEAVNILELAERMVRLSGHQVGTEIPIRFTGVRPGEKLSEDLQNPEEEAHETLHPSIVRLIATRIDAENLAATTHELARLVDDNRDDEAARLMTTLAHSPAHIVRQTTSDLAQAPGRDAWSPLTT